MPCEPLIAASSRVGRNGRCTSTPWARASEQRAPHSGSFAVTRAIAHATTFVTSLCLALYALWSVTVGARQRFRVIADVQAVAVQTIVFTVQMQLGIGITVLLGVLNGAFLIGSIQSRTSQARFPGFGAQAGRHSVRFIGIHIAHMQHRSKPVSFAPSVRKPRSEAKSSARYSLTASLLPLKPLIARRVKSN